MAGRFDSYTFPPKYIRAARAALILLEFLQLLEDLLDIRFFANVVNVDVFHNAVLINNEHRAFAHARVFAQHAVRFCNRTVRPEIA